MGEKSNDWLGVPNCPNCKVRRSGYFDRSEAEMEFNKKLAKFLGVPLKKVKGLAEETYFADLGMSFEQMRKFERLFYVYADEVIDLDTGEIVDFSNKSLPPVPPTMKEFVDRIWENGQSPLIDACAQHAV